MPQSCEPSGSRGTDPCNGERDIQSRLCAAAMEGKKGSSLRMCAFNKEGHQQGGTSTRRDTCAFNKEGHQQGGTCVPSTRRDMRAFNKEDMRAFNKEGHACLQQGGTCMPSTRRTCVPSTRRDMRAFNKEGHACLQQGGTCVPSALAMEEGVLYAYKHYNGVHISFC